MRRQRTSNVFFLALVVCGGCDDSGAKEMLVRDLSAPVQTSALHYDFSLVHLGIETTIQFIYRNQTADTVYLLNCSGWPVVKIQKQEPDSWNRV
jgi:hypothetical protein